MRKTIKRTGFIAVSAVALTSVGLAVAAWTATGTGSGSSKAVEAQDIVVAGSTTTADLYPGMTAGKLFVELKNPNSYPVTITGITAAAGDRTVATAGPVTTGSACAVNSVSFATQSVSWLLPPRAGYDSNAVVIKDVVGVSMIPDAGNQCQGAVFSLPVTVSGASSAS